MQFEAAVDAWSVGPVPPWPALPDEHVGPIRLWAATNERETGTVIRHLAARNDSLDRVLVGTEADEALARLFARPAEEIVARTAAVDELSLSGGILVRDTRDGREIRPGCCSALEDWVEWIRFERTGETPWTGHDPDPWLEREGEIVRVWSHGALSDFVTTPAFHVDLSAAEFRAALARVEQDLQDFLEVLRRWTQRHAPAAAELLGRAFARSFLPDDRG